VRYLNYFGVVGLLVFFLVGWLTLTSQNSDVKLVEKVLFKRFFQVLLFFALLRFRLAAPGVLR
jgi:hypothetical protein